MNPFLVVSLAISLSGIGSAASIIQPMSGGFPNGAAPEPPVEMISDAIGLPEMTIRPDLGQSGGLPHLAPVTITSNSLVPEPASVLLGGIGLLALFRRRFR